MSKSTQITTDTKGFTIVELLIVIVVIGILAAITIVAFNGIQNRGKAASGQALASGIVKKIEAYNSINSAYPTTPAQIQSLNESRIDNIVTSVVNITDATSTTAFGTTAPAVAAFSGSDSHANGGKAVFIAGNASGGFVYWWDYTQSTDAARLKPLKYGP